VGSYPYKRRDFSRSAELYTVEYGFFLLLLASDMPLLWKSFFDMWDILCEGPCEKKPGLYVGGKMVQCVSCLWRLVLIIGIHHYYHRTRIPS